MSASQRHDGLIRIATYSSVTLATLLIVGKMVAWVMSDSLTVLTSLIDSLFDLVTSVVNAFAAHYALKPADEDHRFGHGKAEDIAALVQSAFIAGSAMFVGIESVHRFFQPVALKYEGIAITVMGIAMALTFLLVLFQRFVSQETGSKVVAVDALHYVSDIAVNGLVIVTLSFSLAGISPLVDVGASIIIIVYISYSAWGIGKNAFDNLMDKECSTDVRQQIMEIVLKEDGVKGIHDLRTRYSGITPFIQFHLELDGSISLADAHIIGHKVEDELLLQFPRAEILIHHDPEPIADLPPQLQQMKSGAI